MFVANMARLVDRLGASPGMPVQIVSGADDVCAACPHMSDGMCVRPGQQVDDLDRRVMARLGLDDGHSRSWSSIIDAIRDKIDPFRLEDVCGGCSWLELDYCTNGLASLAGTPVPED